MRRTRPDLTLLLLWGLALLLSVEPTVAQSAHAGCPLRDQHTNSESAVSPYAGLQERHIKALSDQEQEQLLAGHGMGLALVAELNHYPGPKHVLESATLLDLTEEQVLKTQAIFHAMKARAQALGQQLIDAEAALDQDFASFEITRAGLTERLRAIGKLRADLRAAHLIAHLEMRDALTPGQIRRYDTLRGYDSPARAQAGD